MTYIVDLDAYELHPGDEKKNPTLLMNTRVSHYTCGRVTITQKHIFC